MPHTYCCTYSNQNTRFLKPWIKFVEKESFIEKEELGNNATTHNDDDDDDDDATAAAAHFFNVLHICAIRTTFYRTTIVDCN